MTVRSISLRVNQKRKQDGRLHYTLDMPPKKKQSDPSLVVGYVRVSTEEQGASRGGITAQEDRIKDEVTRRDWQLTAIHTDIASGKTTEKRPGLTDALRDVRTGKAGTLMVAKLDRLSRSVLDFSRLVAQARSEGWNIVSLDLGVDLSTPNGKFMANVMASFAELEREIIGQRTSEALRAKQREGVILGRRPILDSKLRKRLREEREAGRSYQKIADQLNDEGIPTALGKTWYRATVKAALEIAA